MLQLMWPVPLSLWLAMSFSFPLRRVTAHVLFQFLASTHTSASCWSVSGCSCRSEFPFRLVFAIVADWSLTSPMWLVADLVIDAVIAWLSGRHAAKSFIPKHNHAFRCSPPPPTMSGGPCPDRVGASSGASGEAASGRPRPGLGRRSETGDFEKGSPFSFQV